MARPDILTSVDLPSNAPAATGRFYATVFGWENGGRPEGGRYWSEFNGFHACFVDPWGSQVLLWTKGGDDPQFTPDMEGKV